MLYTIFETANFCAADPRDYLRRLIVADIDKPYPATLPTAIEEVLTMLDE